MDHIFLPAMLVVAGISIFAGISHLIAHTFPRTGDAVSRLGEAAAQARERLGATVAGGVS